MNLNLLRGPRRGKLAWLTSCKCGFVFVLVRTPEDHPDVEINLQKIRVASGIELRVRVFNRRGVATLEARLRFSFVLELYRKKVPPSSLRYSRKFRRSL